MYRLAQPFLFAALVLAGCAGHRIPGTEIKDTADSRAVIATIDTYRRAAERRDAATVLSLVSPKYFDKSASGDPADDINYDQLKSRIANDYKKITALRLDIGVKKVDIDGEAATAYVLYDERYRIATKAGQVAKQASDVHRMQFAREGGAWHFVSGL
ncbi:MAG TPA: hypothetical protein VMK12_14440 [Anaeromyxobacteraceae bacterium]|nr:hypothetical protein [Anaeromyxobacteraceae bacterium]